MDRCADVEDVVFEEAGRVCDTPPAPHDDAAAAADAAAIASPADDDERATPEMAPAAESDATSPTTTPVA